MSMSLDNIHKLEYVEDYPAAINELELRLKENPNEVETIIRLGFNLWYAVVENDSMEKNLPVKQYASRFMALFYQYQDTLKNSADFCWVFGQGIQMFWFYFPGATEMLGQLLIDNACRLDNFYKHFWKNLPHCLIAERFKGRSIFDKYYCKLPLSAYIRKEQKFQIFVRGKSGEWETYDPSVHGPAESITKGYAAAYSSGELLQNCDNGKDLPLGTRYVSLMPYKVIKMPECVVDPRVSIVHEPGVYRRGHYCTKLTNTGDVPFKVNRFAAFIKKGFFGSHYLSTISNDWFYHEHFLCWYNAGQEWIQPGSTVADQDNYGSGKGYWVYEIEFKNKEVIFVKSRLPDKRFKMMR
jgi:hypothetical protein